MPVTPPAAEKDEIDDEVFTVNRNTGRQLLDGASRRIAAAHGERTVRALAHIVELIPPVRTDDFLRDSDPIARDRIDVKDFGTRDGSTVGLKDTPGDGRTGIDEPRANEKRRGPEGLPHGVEKTGDADIPRDQIAHRRVGKQKDEPPRKLPGGRAHEVLLDAVVQGVFGFGKTHLAIEQQRDDAAPRIRVGKRFRTDHGRREQRRRWNRKRLFEARVKRVLEHAVTVAIEIQRQRRRRREEIQRELSRIAGHERNAGEYVTRNRTVRPR